MPSNNSKHTPEIREQIARYVLESGKRLHSSLTYMSHLAYRLKNMGLTNAQ